MHILEADSIQLSFGLRKVLSDIYVKCETGKITGLLGRNGQGKTCLLNILYGSMAIPDKSIRLDGKVISHGRQIRGVIKYLPQHPFIPSGFSLKRIFRDFRIDFHDFGILFPELLPMHALSFGNLAGGQKRLVEVYCILRSESKFVLLDEPFTHIMPAYVEKIRGIIQQEKSAKGIMLTDHLHHQIMDISDTLYMLNEGRTQLVKTRNDLVRSGYVKA